MFWKLYHVEERVFLKNFKNLAQSSWQIYSNKPHFQSTFQCLISDKTQFHVNYFLKNNFLKISTSLDMCVIQTIKQWFKLNYPPRIQWHLPDLPNRVFSLTWPVYIQIYWNKRKRLHKKRVQLPEGWFGTPAWPPFHCFGTSIWPPWRHVKTLYSPLNRGL